MNINPWIFYIADLCDNVKDFGLIIGCLALLFGAIFLFMFISSRAMLEEPERDILRKIYRTLFSVCAVCLALGIFVPSKETVLMQTIVPKLVELKSVQKLPDALEKFIDEYLKERTKK